ncbi:multidrug effflux MFS transporter [Martelella sp. HB161492]|uniref:multidrug effflux MFS transporter n=1 Tax=Martelella sp. HB161492 TaxID=2720726 RepID=UPI001FED4EA0|nr:multidrug effflux MFS transporter [Martelella sp. HB161492]
MTENTAAAARPTMSKWEVVVMMAMLMALNALAIDIMLPGLQQIGASLGVEDENSRQFIVTAYVLGMGFAQLFFGPLSDRFGRKLPLLAGIIVYLAGSLAAAIVPSFMMMLVIRFIQGIGSASTRVISISIVRDLYGGRKMAEVMSLVMMVFMIIPIVAPTIGQSILFVGEWHLIFLFLALFAAAMFLWVLIRLPETLNPKDVREFSVASVVRGFIMVLSNGTAALYILAATLIQGCMFGYITSAQQIYIEVFGIGTLFPIAFAGIGVVLSASALANSRMVGKFGMRRLSQTALIGFVATMALWLILDLAFGGHMPFLLFYALFAIGWFQYGWLGANINTMAMEPLGHIAGIGSSVLGFTGTAGSALLGSLVGLSFNGTTTPLITGFFCFGVATLAVVVIAERGKLFRPHNPAAE